MPTASLWNDLLACPGEKAHMVQFYQDRTLLGSTVGYYFSEGLKRGEAAVAIATGDLWEQVRRNLEDRGHDPARLQQQGRLIVREARETLDAILRNGKPDETLFAKTIGPVLTLSTPEGSRVRAFGEMVSILWQERRYDAAIRLEELWNRLVKSRDFTLLCACEGYILAPEFHGSCAEGLFREHSHVIPLNYDRLTNAVDRAMDEVLGASHAAALRPLIAAGKRRIAVMPGAQTSLLWLQTHLPERIATVLSTARRHYDLRGEA